MDDLTTPPATATTPSHPAPAPAPLRFQGRWPLVAVLFLEGLAAGSAVWLQRSYGQAVLGHGLAVLLVPGVLLTGTGLFLCAWRASIRPRSVLGWLLLLLHLGTFVGAATVGAAGLQMKHEAFPAFVRQELDLVLQAMAAPVDSVGTEVAGVTKAIEPGSEEIGDAVAIAVPEAEPARGDSLLAKGPQEWDVLVRHDASSEAVVRSLVSGTRRVPLTYPDSGEAWSADGEVTLLQCHREPVAAVTQLGLCPKRTAEASAEQGFGCEEPVVPHLLLVNLRTGHRRLLGSEVGTDAALDSAQQWFKGERCAL